MTNCIIVSDITRPIQLGNQSKQSSKNKRKLAESYVSDERVCRFANNDEYSLQEMVK